MVKNLLVKFAFYKILSNLDYNSLKALYIIEDHIYYSLIKPDM